MYSAMMFKMNTRARITVLACAVLLVLQCSFCYGQISCPQCTDATVNTFVNGQLQAKNPMDLRLTFPSNPACAANTQPATPCRQGVVLCERIAATFIMSEKNKTTNATLETRISATEHKCSANTSMSLASQCQTMNGTVNLLAMLMAGQTDMMNNLTAVSTPNTTVSGQLCYTSPLGGNFNNTGPLGGKVNNTGHAVVPLGHVILFMSPLWIASTLW